jgi:hypothetical protein
LRRRNGEVPGPTTSPPYLQVSTTLKRLERTQAQTQSAIGQIPAKLTPLSSDMHTALSKELKASLPKLLDGNIASNVNSAFSIAIVPAFEKAMQSMFEQVRHPCCHSLPLSTSHIATTALHWCGMNMVGVPVVATSNQPMLQRTLTSRLRSL